MTLSTPGVDTLASRSAGPGANWAGTYSYRAPLLVSAKSVSEVIEAVSRPGRVRALGTRHSFNDIADTTGTLVSVLDLDPGMTIDPVGRTVSVGAGTSYGVLVTFLQQHGWALHNTGSLPHISIGGATAQGTHGSGNANGNLSTAVRALEIVDARGTVRSVQSGDLDFEGHVVALGALGIVVRITLAIEPSYDVRQDVFKDLSWDAVLDDVTDVMASAYSVSLFTNWSGDTLSEAWLKTRLDQADAPPPMVAGGTIQNVADVQIHEGEAANLTIQGGLPGPWSERLPHFRADAKPSNGDEIQSEYFVELSRAADALQAVRALHESITPLLLVSELRSVAADELWLSPAFEQDVLGIHFTWRNDPKAVAPVLKRIETALAPFNPRPHWGKTQALSPELVAGLYPRLPDFRRLLDRWDPERRFSNARLQQLFG
ncbi:xylitol oxidase [Paenarthrobacter sp. A20]|nr:xylitol oxidase [Paenarthrobacter sp. A20]